MVLKHKRYTKKSGNGTKRHKTRIRGGMNSNKNTQSNMSRSLGEIKKSLDNASAHALSTKLDPTELLRIGEAIEDYQQLEKINGLINKIKKERGTRGGRGGRGTRGRGGREMKRTRRARN